MNPEQIYNHCCETTQDLLRGFATRDLSLIEERVVLLRQYLSRRPVIDLTTASGQSLLRLEQLDALEAITAQMEQSLQLIRQSAQTEFDRMLSTRALFRHLTNSGGKTPDLALPVC